MTVAIRGPYCTGASAPSGAAPFERCPQPHSRRSIPVTGRLASPAPHRLQHAGSCRSSRSGLATCASVWPGCPSCPPCLRPVFFRSDRDQGGGFASPSADG